MPDAAAENYEGWYTVMLLHIHLIGHTVLISLNHRRAPFRNISQESYQKTDGVLETCIRLLLAGG